MSILIIADHDGQALRDTTMKTAQAALSLGSTYDVLVYGKDIEAVASQAASLHGASKVHMASSDALKADIAEVVSHLIVSLASSFTHIIFPATSSGKNIAPRVAALIDGALISDVLEIIDTQTFVRPIYAGNALETLKLNKGSAVLTVRTTAFKPVALDGKAEMVSVSFEMPNVSAEFVSEEKVVSARPELGAAKIIVSGGRALGSSEEFTKILEPLADRLGAAIGASRAAVDAGYAPNDYQVGQTGKVVAPDLYIAIGISGAIQHLAGMKDSKVIVAINKDAEAPIFSVADYGLVADYQSAIPELMKALS
jgi:electron transfer flavoprotein alpha subunit